MDNSVQYKGVIAFFHIEREKPKHYRVFVTNAWGVVVFQHWFAGIRKPVCKRIAEKKFWKKVMENDSSTIKLITKRS